VPGSLPAPDPLTLTAGGTVEPSSSPASRIAEAVTATATVTFTNPAGSLSSGSLFLCALSENYNLTSGSKRQPPVYENFVSSYQRPGDVLLNTLQANFPLRPLLLFGPEELADVTVKVDVLTPQAFSGTVFDEHGGYVAANGVEILAGTAEL